MTFDIEPGQWVTVTVRSEPRTEARRKTMIRLFRRDPAVAREHKRLARSRPVVLHRRGGRPWANRPPQLKVVRTKPGTTYRLFASVDVLRDLRSVAAHVEVAPAG